MKKNTLLRALIVTTSLAAAPYLRAAGVKLADPIPAPIPASGVTVALVPVATGLTAPVAAAFAPEHGKVLFVAEQTGQIWAVDVSRHGGDGGGSGGSGGPVSAPPPPRLFADLSSRLVTLGLFGIHYDERGLLGIAFHPEFEENGLLYTFTSEPPKGAADFTTLPAGVVPNAQSVLTEWRVVDPEADELVLDLASAREVLRIDKPQFNHNGGSLAFGPDRLLYVSTGDGGNADDQGVGHSAGGNAQDLSPTNLLGKVLRIDPLGRDSKNGKYGIPADNPFVASGPAEVFAYGFRNPFRLSFDTRTGALWTSDVGQNDIEEVDVVRAGGNYGWPVKEGTFLFDNNGTGNGFVTADSPGSPAGLIDPVGEYDHTSPVPGVKEGLAAIGGFVYRGKELKELRGKYVFGDYSRVFAKAQGRLFVLEDKPCGSTAGCVEELGIDGSATLGWAVLGFGEDARGEIYLLANQTGVTFGSTGAVLRLSRVKR